MDTTIVNNKKIINAWCMYDWANSVYNLVITATIFPVYYNAVTSSEISDKVSFFGFEMVNTVLYSWSLSFSFLLVAIVSPLLSGIADYSGKKKAFMRMFMLMGSTACMGLYFFDGNNLEFGIICAVLASVGYSGSLVFYNAFIPVISTPDKYDYLSARGFAMGYLGSIFLLILNLAMIQMPEMWGFTGDNAKGDATRFSFLLVGVWWIGFSMISFYFLPSNAENKPKDSRWLVKGYDEIRKVMRSLKDLPVLRKYLLAFFFWSAGVQTVMYLAASFGDKVLKMPGSKLIMTVLIIQLVGVAGSYVFAYLSKVRGNKFSLMVMVVIWIFICLAAYFVYTEYQFYMLAFTVGLVMGGIQALSRATYSKLIPLDTVDHTSYFSFYDVTYNISIVFGTLAYGFIEQVTGDMRNSVIGLMGFFLVGIVFLVFVKIPSFKEQGEQV